MYQQPPSSSRPIAPPPPFPPTEYDRRTQTRQSTFTASDVPAYYPGPSSSTSPAPHPPPFLHHNSEGTNHFNRDGSASPSSSSAGSPSSWGPLRPSVSTSDLPAGNLVGRRLSRAGGPPNSSQYAAYQQRPPPTGSNMGEQHGYEQRLWEDGPPPSPPPRQSGSGGRTPPTHDEQQDREFEEAMRASRLEAEMAMAEQASFRAEEDRLLQSAMAASSYSAEQEVLRAERIAAEKKAELDAIQKAIAQSQVQADKGKQRETEEERQEREAIEYVMALSISEMNARKSTVTKGETSAEMFARLSRPSLQVDPDNVEVSPEPSPSSHPTPPIAQSRTALSDDLSSSSSTISEAAPPAYEYPKTVDNPRAIVLGPGRPLPRPPGPAGAQQPRPPPAAPRRSASSSSTSAPQGSSHSRHASFSRVTPSSNIPANASAYYSASVAAASSPSRRPNIFADYPRGQETTSPQPTPPVTGDTSASEEDPFDDSHAAIGSTHGSSEDISDLWALTRKQSRSKSLASTSTTSLPSAGAFDDANTTSHRRPSLGTAGSTASLPTLPVVSSSLAVPSPPIALAERRASPLFGGLVDFSTANAVADEEVTRGVTFGFVPPGTEGWERRPLEHDGAFPDVAQLSRVGSIEGGNLEFECFAVEAGGWQSLLSYLMWHGNSHMEAAPSDLRSEKIGDGLCCAVVLDFFRAAADRQPRVRCRLSLLPPRHQYDPLAGDAPANFDVDHPNITIRFPSPPLLPLKLSTLATTLSTAHTLSRRYRTDARTTPNSPEMRTIRDLAQAVDLFKALNGEVIVHDAEEVQIAEDNWLSGMKLRLKRKKKGPGIVKGGADGTGGGRPLEGNMALPEAALLVTPFRLDDV